MDENLLEILLSLALPDLVRQTYKQILNRRVRRRPKGMSSRETGQ
jgi:hypothetical protein